MLLTAMLLRSQRAIVRRFEEAGATRQEASRRADELGLGPGMAWHQLVAWGVLRCPGEGRYFLDVDRWTRLMRQRRRHAWVVGTAILLLVVLLFWLRAAAA